MESHAAASLTVANAFPAYKWNTESTDKVIGRLTPELFAWRPDPKDGSWHFSLGELAAHITDAALMFHGQLLGEELPDDAWFMKPPEDFEGGPGIWTPTREFTADEVKTRLADMRSKWAEILSWPIEKAHQPTEGTKKQFEDLVKQAEEGKFPKEMLTNGPSTPMRVAAAMVSHEAAHRGTMLTLMRVHHGVSFSNAE